MVKNDKLNSRQAIYPLELLNFSLIRDMNSRSQPSPKPEQCGIIYLGKWELIMSHIHSTVSVKSCIISFYIILPPATYCGIFGRV